MNPPYTSLNWVQSAVIAHRQQLIAVALDISRSHLREAIQDRAGVVRVLIKGQDPDSTVRLTEEELERVRSLADNLEFYARLAEDEQLNPAYLSEALVCTIVFAADTAIKYKLSIPTPNGKRLALSASPISIDLANQALFSSWSIGAFIERQFVGN